MTSTNAPFFFKKRTKNSNEETPVVLLPILVANI